MILHTFADEPPSKLVDDILRRVEAETPLEPDAAIAAERVPSPVRRVALAVGRWLVAIGEAS